MKLIRFTSFSTKIIKGNEMQLSREEVSSWFTDYYRREYEEIGQEGIEVLLDRGRAWDFSGLLRSGGVVVFPHIHLADCGPYVAAAVHACLDCGADQILALGVLHTSSEAMDQARSEPASPLRGFYGPGLEGPLDTWRQEYSLFGFRNLLADEARRRGVPAPRLVERYPFLTGGHPETMPGLEEVASIAKGSVIVSTADHCHHGIGYGDSPADAIYPDDKGLEVIRDVIETGLDLLDEGHFGHYEALCKRIRSDWRDAGPIIHHLRSPLRSRVHALIAGDYSRSVYNAPKPTWAAGALATAAPPRATGAVGSA